MAAIWRFSIRHAFFASGHACSFNRLQFSAAFVTTETFEFIRAGTSLFLNTFGWEVLGLFLIWNTVAQTRSYHHYNISAWKWYCWYQVLESVGACISVSLMKRHLMVWAIFAPHFAFSVIFSIITIVFQIIVLLIWSNDIVHQDSLNNTQLKIQQQKGVD
mmetsp:Transcript_47058/g.47512  ORF Transcript_47058/g.47512 Transcript_47058/m.47512 type:complete len:160 (-) Transcript_47058:136-615(-)